MVKSERTKAKIKKAALYLFNLKGTGSVTTHDIAAKADMSVGNLYYHYKNKEEVIFDIFNEIPIFQADQWTLTTSFPEFLKFFFGSVRKYRFFFNEFSVLVHNDIRLKQDWRKKYVTLINAMNITAEEWVTQGILKPFRNQNEFECFVDGTLLSLNFSTVYLEVKEEYSSKILVDKSIDLVLHFLLPYHTERGQKELLCILK